MVPLSHPQYFQNGNRVRGKPSKHYTVDLPKPACFPSLQRLMPETVLLPRSTAAPANSSQDEPPCHTEACAIQTCLSRNAYKEERCKWALGDLYQCCQEFYYKNPEGKSASCPEYTRLQKILSLKVKEKEKRY
jgi:hypothetical protein